MRTAKARAAKARLRGARNLMQRLSGFRGAGAKNAEDMLLEIPLQHCNPPISARQRRNAMQTNMSQGTCPHDSCMTFDT